MTEKAIVITMGLLFGVPLTLILWAHIYVAVRDIVAKDEDAQ